VPLLLSVVIAGFGVPLLVGSCDNSLANLFTDSMVSVRLTPAAPLVRISLYLGSSRMGFRQRGLTETKKRVFLKCELSTCALSCYV
jgi:hypothetical protein